MSNPITSQNPVSEDAYIQALRQGIHLQSKGEWQAAEAHYLALLPAYAEEPRLLTLLASLYLQLARYDDCLQFAMQSLTVQGEQPEVWNMAGDACYLQGRYEEAFTAYSTACQLQPDNSKTWFDAGNAQKMLGNNADAKQFYEQAIALNPRYAEAHHNLGVVLREQRQWQEALAAFNKAVELQPDYVEAYANCGNVLADMGQHEYALAHFDHALTLNPHHAIALNGRGVALQNRKQYEDALASLDQAIAARPGFSEAWLNHGNVLLALGRHDDAFASYGQAAAIAPQNSRIYSNRGNAHLDIGEYAAALADYEQAIALDAGNATAWWNKALIHIVQGDYAQGWRLYEHGWAAEGPPRGHRKQCPQPLWMGDDDLTGKRILLTAEQGFGDTIQFSRYALLVAELAGAVMIEAPKPLMALMQSMNTIGEHRFTVIERGTEYTDFDYYCPYMSLPLAFQTRVDTVPAPIPYLRAETSRLAKFGLDHPHAEKRTTAGTRLRVGLVWSGSATHMRDAKRSIPLADLRPLLDLPIEFHALQKEFREQDAQWLPGLPIINHSQALQDFSDTAALTDAMDLVISVDTSVAHLAGALGKPVWVLLPKIPDYRWLLDREDSPWYPTARLFRQSALQDWATVIAQVRQALQQWSAAAAG